MYIIFPVVFMLIADLIWITANKSKYAQLVSAVQHKPMKVNTQAAIIAYAAMVLGLVAFVIPAAKADPSSNKKIKALRHGALFGFVVYAIYNATNYAIFQDYSLTTAVLDTIWGTTVYFASTLVALS